LRGFAGVWIGGAALTFFASVIIIGTSINTAGDETQRIGVIYRAVPNIGVKIDSAPAFTPERIFADKAV